MRFNKSEMMTLAMQPAQKFDKEGVLIIRERREGFFKRSERPGSSKRRKSKSLQELSCYAGTNKVSVERWCRLRGNLLFYLKTKEHWSEPVGLIVLLDFSIRLDHSNFDGTYGFFLVFEFGLTQHIATFTEHERNMWMEAIQIHNYNNVRSQLTTLQDAMRIQQTPDSDVEMQKWRIRKGYYAIDTVQIPLCEISLSCDNLLCDGHGRPPRTTLVVDVYIPSEDVWIKYANTEIVEKSSNPTFMKSVCLWASDGLRADTCVRVTAYDVREKFSGVATSLGGAKLYLPTVLEGAQTRVRMPLLGTANTVVGFLTLTVWRYEDVTSASAESTPCRSMVQHTNNPCHRRTQSLPSRFIVKQKIPQQEDLPLFFDNAVLSTYRFHSGLGGDISVFEIMAESKLCFYFPQRCLEIFMNEEKELLQEVAGMGELVEPWNSRQLEILDRHLQLLHLYSQAKESLRSFEGSYFKPSSRKTDRSLEFAPVNLHLQRMWVQNDTLKKQGFYDVITVGAFTAHSHRTKNGGLIRLIQQLKESPVTASGVCSSNKISTAYDAIQAIKLLRREVVDGMRLLMKLAKNRECSGMLPICEDMILKTQILLSLWDPELVEEALNFIEKNKVTVKQKSKDSQFKKMAQQLNLKQSVYGEFDDEITPDECKNSEELWKMIPSNSTVSKELDIFVEENAKKVDVSEIDDTKCEKKETETMTRSTDENTANSEHVRTFLDTHAMCSSPSANYYKPTDEPEPWDLTQFNIEASVICLVSKVKSLCGRSGSPPVRIRPPTLQSSQTFVMEKQVPQETLPSLSEQLDSEVPVEKAQNKFTEDLEFNTVKDWTSELKPSMRKLRQAMDGLLKTARLTHSVFRIQEDRKIAQAVCNVRYRRVVCLSQALTALVTNLMTKLWCQKVDPVFLNILTTIGPLVSFEGLLSYYGDEVDMWGDMVVAIEDLTTVSFTLMQAKTKNASDVFPKVTGSRSALNVLLPIPEAVFSYLPALADISFRVTPIFFNIGINEMATIAESLGAVRPQEQSNIDNFDRLNEYYHRFKRLQTVPTVDSAKTSPHCSSLSSLIRKLKDSVHSGKSKNVEVLQLSGQICRKMKGLRFTSCKSAKDRSGMAVTLEQCNILQTEYDLADNEFQRALDCMRSEGVRRENTFKNVGMRKYAFNNVQVYTFPKQYKPPCGTYGTVQS